jgi:acyl carrier protein phosphodiesterase
MNILAHLYLSGNSADIKIGNFIGDYVKGHDYQDYPELVRKGIILHRHIDSYTDQHPIVSKAKTRLADQYHKYAGIIIDIFFDHYLSKDWAFFSSTPLKKYIDQTNELLMSHYDMMPARVQSFLPKFVDDRWLAKYNTVKGIEGVLVRMAKNTTLPELSPYAINILKKYYDIFNQEFYSYFGQLMNFVNEAHGIAFPDIKKE